MVAGISRAVWPIAIVLLVFYFLFDPLETAFMPQCLFHRFTGLQCMGCGSQRVVHYLLHGNITEAFRANALLVISLPFLFALLWIEIKRKKYPGLYAGIHSKFFIITVGIVLILWLIVRNILGV